VGDVSPVVAAAGAGVAGPGASLALLPGRGGSDAPSCLPMGQADNE
jgi:hypothetical protein